MRGGPKPENQEPNVHSPARIRESQEWPGALRHGVIEDFEAERRRQNEKHPDTVNFPDGTGHQFAHGASIARAQCDVATAEGRCTWMHVLREEVCEAFAESDPDNLRKELVQVMAVAGRWIETIDARQQPSTVMGCGELCDGDGCCG